MGTLTGRLTGRPLTGRPLTATGTPSFGLEFLLSQRRPFLIRVGPFLDFLPFKGPFPPYGSPYGQTDYGEVGGLTGRLLALPFRGHLRADRLRGGWGPLRAPYQEASYENTPYRKRRPYEGLLREVLTSPHKRRTTQRKAGPVRGPLRASRLRGGWGPLWEGSLRGLLREHPLRKTPSLRGPARGGSHEFFHREGRRKGLREGWDLTALTGRLLTGRGPLRLLARLKEAPRTQNPKCRTQNSKSKIQNPKSKTQKVFFPFALGKPPRTQNPKSKTQNQKPKAQNPKSKIQNPKSKVVTAPSQGLGSYLSILSSTRRAVRQHHWKVLGLLARLPLAAEPAALTAATLAAGKRGARGSLKFRGLGFRVYGFRGLGFRV